MDTSVDHLNRNILLYAHELENDSSNGPDLCIMNA